MEECKESEFWSGKPEISSKVKYTDVQRNAKCNHCFGIFFLEIWHFKYVIWITDMQNKFEYVFTGYYEWKTQNTHDKTSRAYERKVSVEMKISRLLKPVDSLFHKHKSRCFTKCPSCSFPCNESAMGTKSFNNFQ